MQSSLLSLQPPSSPPLSAIKLDSQKEHQSINNSNNKEEQKDDYLDSKEFKDLGEIGWGHSGIVYKSIHKSTGLVYARKVILHRGKQRREVQEPSIPQEIFIRRYLAGEAEESSVVGVVNWYGELQSNQKDAFTRTSFLMELMDAGSVADLLVKLDGRGIGDERILGRLTRSILIGVQYLHGRGVIHRDLKPSNLLLNGRGQLKIGDLGEAAIITPVTSDSEIINSHLPAQRHSVVGSMAYMAPERLEGNGHAFPADIWAIGVILLELAIGPFPFTPRHNLDSSIRATEDTGSLIELWEMIMTEREGLQKTIASGPFSPALCDLLQSCLTYEANGRPSASHLLQTSEFLRESVIASENEVATWLNQFLHK